MPDIVKAKENDQNIKFKMFLYTEIKKSIFFDLIRMELFKGRRKQVQDIITKCSLNKLAAKLPHRKENKKRSNVM